MARLAVVTKVGFVNSSCENEYLIFDLALELLNMMKSIRKRNEDVFSASINYFCVIGVVSSTCHCPLCKLLLDVHSSFTSLLTLDFTE